MVLRSTNIVKLLKHKHKQTWHSHLLEHKTSLAGSSGWGEKRSLTSFSTLCKHLSERKKLSLQIHSANARAHMHAHAQTNRWTRPLTVQKGVGSRRCDRQERRRPTCSGKVGLQQQQLRARIKKKSVPKVQTGRLCVEGRADGVRLKSGGSDVCRQAAPHRHSGRAVNSSASSLLNKRHFVLRSFLTHCALV